MRYRALRRLVVGYEDDPSNIILDGKKEVAVQPGDFLPDDFNAVAIPVLLRQNMIVEDSFSELDERLRVIEEHLGIRQPEPVVETPDEDDHEVEVTVRRRKKKPSAERLAQITSEAEQTDDTPEVETQEEGAA